MPCFDLNRNAVLPDSLNEEPVFSIYNEFFYGLNYTSIILLMYKMLQRLND